MFDFKNLGNHDFKIFNEEETCSENYRLQRKNIINKNDFSI